MNEVIEEWKLEIVRGDNGFILKGRFGDSELITKHVIEEKDEEFGELEAMQNLLWEVMEYFGCYYSKHQKKNLTIEIVENK